MVLLENWARDYRTSLLPFTLRDLIIKLLLILDELLQTGSYP